MASSQQRTVFFKGKVQPGEGLQADYSYTQWRHAQMQQLEGDYAAQCERDLRSGAFQGV